MLSSKCYQWFIEDDGASRVIFPISGIDLCDLSSSAAKCPIYVPKREGNLYLSPPNQYPLVLVVSRNWAPVFWRTSVWESDSSLPPIDSDRSETVSSLALTELPRD